MENIKVLTMKVGEMPQLRVVDVSGEGGTYELLRKSVGGYIEALTVTDTCTLWINEEGKLIELEPNFILTDRVGNIIDFIAGDVIFTGIDEEGNTVSLSEEDLEVIQERFTDRFHFKYYA